MRIVVVFICSILILNVSLSAQENKMIIVKAGTKLLDYFPFNERYLYAEFIPGQVVLKNGKSSNLKINYNILYGEMEFIQYPDTLSIADSKKKEIKFIAAQDTFYYDNGFIKVISGGQLKVGLKQYVKIKDILKKGAYGSTSRSTSIDTYNTMSVRGMSYDLIPDEDIEFQYVLEYYLLTPSNGFILFSRKNVLGLFPDRADEIKTYIKSNKIDFDSRNDLLRFSEYLGTL